MNQEYGSPEPQNPERDALLQQWEQLLDQGRGWDSIQFLIEHQLPIGDDSIMDALDSLERFAIGASRLGDHQSYERLMREYDAILEWRFGA